MNFLGRGREGTGKERRGKGKGKEGQVEDNGRVREGEVKGR